jgi:hypothetical protein
VLSNTWSLESFKQIPSNICTTSFIRDMLCIMSSNLKIDFEPILQAMVYGQAYRSRQWRRVAVGAQEAIQATMEGLVEVHKHINMSDEMDKRDLTPRTSTNITFNKSATIGFFQSLICYPRPSVRGQPLWDVTMIMDIRYLDIPKARKTGNWAMGIIGSVHEEVLACAYHEKTKLLAYSVSLDYLNKSKQEYHWFMSRLCLCHIGVQSHWDIDPDPRGTFIDSNTYAIGK